MNGTTDRYTARAGGMANFWIIAAVGLSVVVLLEVTASNKVAIYADALERSGLLYAAVPLLIASMLVMLEYPRLSVYLLGLVLPFNVVGGYWGSELFALAAKVAVPVLSAAALLATFLAPPAQRAWITQTRLGRAVLVWLALIMVGIVIGFFGSDPSYWLRESSWMLFFTAALPFGTLLRGRDDVRRLIWCTCAGVAALQTYAFVQLVTGRRYTRPDAWEGGQTFFRAQFSCQSLLVLYLAVAALLYCSSAKTLTRRTALILFTTIALLGGGLLASMTRSLWISGVIGMAVVLVQVPWDRRTAKAAFVVAISAILAVGVVAAFDSLSAESTGGWTSSAVDFFLDLGSKGSASKVTREIEWGNAIDVWKRSPIVGLGFGYAFPLTAYIGLPDYVPDAFYMHNSYLNILAKCGAAGLCAFLYLMWRTFVSMRRLARRSVDLADQILFTALTAAFIQVVTLVLTMPVLTAGDAAAYFGMLIGIVVVVERDGLREAS